MKPTWEEHPRISMSTFSPIKWITMQVVYAVILFAYPLMVLMIVVWVIMQLGEALWG